MRLVLNEVPQSIESYFNDEMPLGPVASENIDDTEVAAYLTTLENEALAELADGASVVFGRKGAGKSSALRAFCFKPYEKRQSELSIVVSKKATSGNDVTNLSEGFRLIVDVNVAHHINKVCSELKSQTIVTPEAAAEAWKRCFWNVAFWQALNDSVQRETFKPQLRDKLSKISSLFQLAGCRECAGDYFREWEFATRESYIDIEHVIAETRAEFISQGTPILVLVDSMEEYDLEFDETLRKAIAGLLQLVATDRSVFSYKIAFPEEIHDQISAESNREKYLLKTAKIKWRASELLKILTSRMLLCLYLNENEVLKSLLKDRRPRSDERNAMLDFWRDLFGGDITNEAGNEEAAIYMVLRHSQMLPRQFINSMSCVVRASATETRNYRTIEQMVLGDALRESCNALVGGIESGFKFTYGHTREVFDLFLPYADIRCDYDCLERVWRQRGVRRYPREYTETFPFFLRALLHMGVFGVVGKETDRYIEATFGYTDDSIMRAAFGHEFVMHPAFSLLYKSPEARRELGRAILPRGALEEFGL